MNERVRVRAKIKKYDENKGYGFLVSEAIKSYSRDIFFHISEFEEAFEKGFGPKVGMTIEFEMEQAPKGIKAIKCKLIEEESNT